MICMALEQNEDYEVEAVHDPHQAYELASAQDYDLLISDVQMPTLEGDKLFLCLGIDPEGGTKRLKRPALLLMSGALNESELRESVKFIEGTSYLKKPFDSATLLMKVAEILWEKRR